MYRTCTARARGATRLVAGSTVGHFPLGPRHKPLTLLKLIHMAGAVRNLCQGPRARCSHHQPQPPSQMSPKPAQLCSGCARPPPHDLSPSRVGLALSGSQEPCTCGQGSTLKWLQPETVVLCLRPHVPRVHPCALCTGTPVGVPAYKTPKHAPAWPTGPSCRKEVSENLVCWQRWPGTQAGDGRPTVPGGGGQDGQRLPRGQRGGDPMLWRCPKEPSVGI